MQQDLELEVIDFQSALSGRLRNLNKLKRWEMAVAELVQNSIDAISDTSQGGAIVIECFRDDRALLPDDDKPIKSVRVTDDGPGFLDRFFVSFRTPDSTHKLKRGGKGIGRLTCLTAFENLSVESVYEENGAWQRRRIELQTVEPPLRSAVSPLNGEPRVAKTAITLTNLRDEFFPQAQVSTESISDWIREHFLPLLVTKPSWLRSFELTVWDGEKKSTVDLCATLTGRQRWQEKFEIGGHSFVAECHEVTMDEAVADKVRLVAAGRVVNSNTRQLDHYVPHVQRIQNQGASVILVHSDYFNDRVNDARNAVSFDSDEAENLPPALGDEFKAITSEDFRSRLSHHLAHRLKDRLDEEGELFRKEVTDVVLKKQPSYRSLLHGYFKSEHFFRLKRNSPASEILHSMDAYRRKDVERMAKLSRRLARMKKNADNYEQQARELASNIDAQKQVALAEYVALRKIILDQLEQIIGREDDVHSRERELHNLIFPQRTDTEASTGFPHQLWIVDERLESHSYLASDQPLDGKQGDRPDILIALDNPSAFGSAAAGADTYDPIILVELKRPLEDLESISTDKLPHRQLMRYAEQIEQEKAVHYRSKRKIKVRSDTRFYMYAICETSAALLKRLKVHENFMVSSTGDGAFSVMNEGRWYVEYISLGKLLGDSRLRNSSFFSRLGLE